MSAKKYFTQEERLAARREQARDYRKRGGEELRKRKATWAKQKYHADLEAAREKARTQWTRDKERGINRSKSESAKAANKKWRNNPENREARLAIKRRYNERHREELNEKQRLRAKTPEARKRRNVYDAANREVINKRQQALRESLPDSYVASVLGLKVGALKDFPEIIQAKREHIRAKRTISKASHAQIP